jgi:hypothetical protein
MKIIFKFWEESKDILHLDPILRKIDTDNLIRDDAEYLLHKINENYSNHNKSYVITRIENITCKEGTYEIGSITFEEMML